MADELNIKKISLLTNAATLTGSELVPCVQNGVTHKTTVTKIKGTTNHSDLTEVKEASDGESEGHVNSDLYNEIKSSSNIIATKGVGLDASKPVTVLTIGDIYVSTDTFLAYTATSTTEWDSGVALLAKQFVSDATTDPYTLYQYNGTVLNEVGGSSVVSSDFIRFTQTISANTTLTETCPVGYEVYSVIAEHISGGAVELASQWDLSYYTLTDPAYITTSEKIRLPWAASWLGYPNSFGNVVTEMYFFSNTGWNSAVVKLYVTLVKII